jgi:hypothetical protein
VLVNNYGNLSGSADGVLQFSTIYDASVSSANLMHFFLDDSGENSSGQVACDKFFVIKAIAPCYESDCSPSEIARTRGPNTDLNSSARFLSQRNRRSQSGRFLGPKSFK